MNYVDLHCDALTNEGVLQATAENLRAGGCLLQCFAAFVPERTGGFSRALALAEKFRTLCAKEGFHAVSSGKEILPNAVNALFTVEGGEAIEGNLQNLETLYRQGARMMTLVWNRPNALAFPAFPDYEGLSSGRTAPSAREKTRGLKPFGEEAVEKMLGLHMLVDVSHGSDKLVEDVFRLCKAKGAPFVASHSGANAVRPWARNLEDRQIRLIAESGGVVGLCFVSDFISGDPSAEGQRSALLAHAEHLIKVGGEDLLAIGSDFDGMPQNPYLKTPADLPKFWEDLTKKFGGRIAEKIAWKNARNVLQWL